MPQPYDIRLPDLVGDFYRGKQMAFNAERAPIEAQQNDQLFAQKQQAIADDQETEMVGNIAGLIASAPAQHRPAMYAQMKGKIAGYAQRHGLPLPEAWDESYLDEVTTLAQQLGKGQQQAKYQNLGDGYIMDGQGNVRRAFQPEEEASWGYIPDPTNPENEVYARRVGDKFYALNGQQLYGGGPQAAPAPAPAPGGGGDFSTLATSIAAKYGFEPTSLLRTPEENAKLPGAAEHSRHLDGEAIDLSVRGKSPQEIAAITAEMKANGMTGGYTTRGTAPHLHFQRPRGAAAKATPPATSSIPGSRPRYKPGANREGLDAKGEMQLRKEYQDLVKEPMVVINAFNKVRAAGANPSAAGDLSMIFAYMKMLDPNSVVRETEFANAQNAAGVPDRIRNLWNRTLSGERLNPNQRADFMAQAENLATQAQTTVASYKNRYSQLANDYGMAPDRIVFSPYDEPQKPQGKQVKRTGTLNGRKVVEYSDGTVAYAD